MSLPAIPTRARLQRVLRPVQLFHFRMSTLRVLTLLFVAGLLLNSCGSGRINRDPAQHLATIKASVEDKDIVVSLDTIYKSGTPVGTVKSEGNMIQETHTFFTLQGEEVINVVQSEPKKGDKTWQEYKILHAKANGSGFIPYSLSTMTVVENVVKNDLLGPDGLNVNAAGRFLLRYPDPDNRPAAPEVNRMVDRNRTRPHLDNFNERKIYQDGRVIGTYHSVRGSLDKDGDEIETKTIYYMDGTVCATVSYKFWKKSRSTIVTSKDNKTHDFVPEQGDIRDVFDRSIEYLIKNLYL